MALRRDACIMRPETQIGLETFLRALERTLLPLLLRLLPLLFPMLRLLLLLLAEVVHWLHNFR